MQQQLQLAAAGHEAAGCGGFLSPTLVLLGFVVITPDYLLQLQYYTASTVEQFEWAAKNQA